MKSKLLVLMLGALVLSATSVADAQTYTGTAYITRGTYPGFGDVFVVRIGGDAGLQVFLRSVKPKWTCYSSMSTGGTLCETAYDAVMGYHLHPHTLPPPTSQHVVYDEARLDEDIPLMYVNPSSPSEWIFSIGMAPHIIPVPAHDMMCGFRVWTCHHDIEQPELFVGGCASHAEFGFSCSLPIGPAHYAALNGWRYGAG